MTDYNDGKWHGWNGGECPVHPETVVECYGGDNAKGKVKSRAKYRKWHCVDAFRVAIEHREPREWYGWVSPSGYEVFFGTVEERQEHVSKHGRDVTCFTAREVLE